MVSDWARTMASTHHGKLEETAENKTKSWADADKGWLVEGSADLNRNPICLELPRDRRRGAARPRPREDV